MLFYDSVSEQIFYSFEPILSKPKVSHVTFNGQESIYHIVCTCLNLERWKQLKEADPLIDHEIIKILGKNPKLTTFRII